MAMSKMQRAKEFIRRRRTQAQDLVKQVRTDAETVAAGGGVAYARGRFGDDAMQVADIDVELLVGGVAKLAAYSGVLGKSMSPDLHAIGTGVLTTYAAFKLLEMGKEHRAEDAATTTSGMRSMGPRSMSGIPRQRQRAA